MSRTPLLSARPASAAGIPLPAATEGLAEAGTALLEAVSPRQLRDEQRLWLADRLVREIGER
jgi:hypothetical protein